MLDGHDILGARLQPPGVGAPPPGTAAEQPNPPDPSDPSEVGVPDSFEPTVPAESPIDRIALRLDGVLSADEPPDGSNAEGSSWDQASLVPDHLGDAFGTAPWGDTSAPDDDTDAGSIDPGGVELLEGPIADTNLDGIDDLAPGHGHG